MRQPRVAGLHVVLAVTWMPWLVIGWIPPNGVCDLNIMLPFTIRPDINDVAVSVESCMTSGCRAMSTGFLTQSRIFNLGYNHLASAVMAMKHFNERDGRITPEVEKLGECNIQFGFNGTTALDTGSVGNLGNSLLFQVHVDRENPICAIAGPFFDHPARNVATMAAAGETPHVPHGGYNIVLSLEELAPFTTILTPDQLALAQAVMSYLVHIGREDYVSFLHPLSDMGVQAALALGVAAEMFGGQFSEYPYVTEFFQSNTVDRAIPNQLKKVKERGFRTILVTLDAYLVDLPAIANAAVDLDMVSGDYVWIFIPVFEKAAIHNAVQLPGYLLEQQGIPSYENVTKLLRGAALMSEMEGHYYLGDNDPFLRAWKEQGPDVVAQVNEIYVNQSIQLGKNDLLMAPNYFQTFLPESGAGRLYDSVMAIGLGACQAAKEESGAVLGNSHKDAIRKVEFTGATGTVAFGDPNAKQQVPSIRNPDTNVYGLYNLYPPSINESMPDADKDSNYDEAFVLTELLTGLEGPQIKRDGPYIKGKPYIGKWSQIGPAFVYADGRLVPTELLRDVPEQNYLPRGLRILGLTIMGIALLACFISLVFVICNWDHRVIRASQPNFLCLLLFGAAITSLAILTVSWDESHGWDEEALSKACMATPWLFCCGHIITYGALFSKLWRVNKVLQFTRRKISAAAVAGPMAALLLATMVVLAAWTIHDPLVWTRTTINDYTGESIAQCNSDSSPIYIPLLAVVVAIPTVLTCVMAWKTKDVDETFTESSWIFTLIILQIQVIMVSFPIVVLLRGSSTEGRYMGLVLLMATFPSSTVILIMVPKFVAYFQSGTSVTSRSSGGRRSRGGSSGGVQISGLSGASSQGKHHSAEIISGQGRHHSSEMVSAMAKHNGNGAGSKHVSFASSDDNKVKSAHMQSAPSEW